MHEHASLEEARQWGEEQWRDSRGFVVPVPCRHDRCKQSKEIMCYTPTQLRFAERSAQHEFWYCHRHKALAWEREGAISYDLFPLLVRLNESPGSNKAKLRGKQRDIDFLLACRLICVDSVPRGSKIGYEIELTESGEQFLVEHAKEISEYMKNQPSRDQLEWYAP